MAQECLKLMASGCLKFMVLGCSIFMALGPRKSMGFATLKPAEGKTALRELKTRGLALPSKWRCGSSQKQGGFRAV